MSTNIRHDHGHEHNTDVTAHLREQARHAFRANVKPGELLWAGRLAPLAIAHRLANSRFTGCQAATYSGPVPLGVEVSVEQAIANVMTPCPRCGFEVHTDG